jgi:hypothetical protein
VVLAQPGDLPLEKLLDMAGMGTAAGRDPLETPEGLAHRRKVLVLEVDLGRGGVQQIDTFPRDLSAGAGPSGGYRREVL